MKTLHVGGFQTIVILILASPLSCTITANSTSILLFYSKLPLWRFVFRSLLASYVMDTCIPRCHACIIQPIWVVSKLNPDEYQIPQDLLTYAFNSFNSWKIIVQDLNESQQTETKVRITKNP